MKLHLSGPGAPAADVLTGALLPQQLVHLGGLRRLGVAIFLLLGLLAAVTVLAAAHGPAHIPYSDAAGVLLSRVGLPGWTFTSTEQQIVEQIRLPRILTAGLVGLALALAGGVLQGLFRNPLADPGLIGVSSGGALAAVVAIALGLPAVHSLLLPASALVGALAAAFTVYAVAASRPDPSGRLTSLVLAGIAVSALAGALTATIISFTEDRERLRDILFWLMGGLDNRTWSHVQLVLGPTLVGGTMCLAFARELNLMLLGDEGARALGVSVPTTRAVLLVACAVMTAAAVSVSGTIAFVGLVVPHVARLLVGHDHRLLLPTAALGGAAFLIAADTLARVLIQPAELRVGVVTSLVGAPLFLYLVYHSRAAAVRA